MATIKGCITDGDICACRTCAFLDDALRCDVFTASHNTKKQTITVED